MIKSTSQRNHRIDLPTTLVCYHGMHSYFQSGFLLAFSKIQSLVNLNLYVLGDDPLIS